MKKNLFDRFEKVLSGHFHTKSEQDNIIYLGSQMEFFWNDAHDQKYFHIIDTNDRTLTPVANPHTLFHRIRYDDSINDYRDFDTSTLDNKFVKLMAINKSDHFAFDRFIDRIQARKIHELKIAENFNEFIGANVDDDSMNFEDTAEIVDTYIDAVDTDLDKNKIKVEMRQLMTEAQALEIA